MDNVVKLASEFVTKLLNENLPAQQKEPYERFLALQEKIYQEILENSM